MPADIEMQVVLEGSEPDGTVWSVLVRPDPSETEACTPSFSGPPILGARRARGWPGRSSMTATS